MTHSAKNTTRSATARSSADEDLRWAKVLTRDPGADGSFYYAVTTTGIYCRPSCAARRARRENVQFHATPAEAESAGFRPCKRCHPERASGAEQQALLVAKACRVIEDADSIPSLAYIAEQAGLSSHYFHRIFKKVTGVTPRQYAVAVRTQRLHRELGQAPSVTEGIYQAGYNSNSRFYEESNKVLGMSAAQFRTGGASTEIRFAIGESSLGAILVAMSRRGVCAILIGDDADALCRDLQDRFPRAQLQGGDGVFAQVVAQVVGFVEAPASGLDLPLDIQGTAFQQRVWQALQKIPLGETASYTDIAQRIGAPSAARAVAGACAANHLAVAIPCHRVVRSDGALSGYRWGVERKRQLLATESDAVLSHTKDRGDLS